MGGNKDHPHVLKLPASILNKDWFEHTHTVFASLGSAVEEAKAEEAVGAQRN